MEENRYKEIYKYCEHYFFEYENPDLAIRNARYFTEGYDAYGLDEEQLRTLKYNVLDKFEPTIIEIGELGAPFFRTGKYEFGSLAILLLKKFRPRFCPELFPLIKEWLDNGVENWAHTDVISTKLTPVFLELKLVELDAFADWRLSSSKWTRRAVPVTMIWLRETADPKELLDFIEPMMQDQEKVVQQGLGWFLRKLWSIHPEEVEEFLERFSQNAPRLIIQYATEKMSKDKKKRFIKEHVNRPKGTANQVRQQHKNKPAHQKNRNNPPKDNQGYKPRRDNHGNTAEGHARPDNPNRSHQSRPKPSNPNKPDNSKKPNHPNKTGKPRPKPNSQRDQ